MAYYGFGLGTRIKTNKPKKIFGKKTGLFDRQMADELKSRHKGHNELHHEKQDKIYITERNKKIFYKGISDQTIKFIAISLVILVVIAFIVRIWFI